MKSIILLIFLIVANSTLLAQPESYVGNYTKRSESTQSKSILEYSLTLNSDSTFLIHIYRNLDPSQPEENWFGKGTWKLEGTHTLVFYSNEQSDLDEKYTLNCTNTKARSNRKSPRNTSLKVEKESLRFFQSEILWLKGLELFKTE